MPQKNNTTYIVNNNKYIYTMHKTLSNGSINYRCTFYKKGCPSSIVINKEGILHSNSKMHNHIVNKEK